MSFPDRVREQSEYFGLTLDETLNVGKLAREEVRRMLKYPFEIHTKWSTAPGRSSQPRIYGIPVARGESLVEHLVENGLACIKGRTVQLPTGEKAIDYLKKLKRIELEAKSKRIGAWRASKSAL